VIYETKNAVGSLEWEAVFLVSCRASAHHIASALGQKSPKVSLSSCTAVVHGDAGLLTLDGTLSSQDVVRGSRQLASNRSSGASRRLAQSKVCRSLARCLVGHPYRRPAEGDQATRDITVTFINGEKRNGSNANLPRARALRLKPPPQSQTTWLTLIQTMSGERALPSSKGCFKRWTS